MDVTIMVGLLLAVSLSSTLGFFRVERDQKKDDFMKTVKKVSMVSSQKVGDFLFTINIYTVKKKKQLLGVVITNARKSDLHVNDILIETKKKGKLIYTSLPDSGFEDKVAFEVESAAGRIITSPLELFIESINSLENSNKFFRLVVIDDSEKKLKSEKLTVTAKTVELY